MEQQNSFLLSIVPLLSTISYLTRDGSFNFYTALPLLLPLAIPIFAQLPGWTSLRMLFRGYCKDWKKQNNLEFNARLRMMSWGDQPDSIVRLFCTVLWDWNAKDKLVNCRSLMEEVVNVRYWNEDYAGTELPFFVDDMDNEFWCADRPHIKYKMWIERNVDREGVAHAELFLQMKFINGKMPDISEHIEFIKTAAKTIKENRGKKQRVLVSTCESDDGRSENGAPYFLTYEFATTSRFDNFFSEEAQTVKSDLDHFLEQKGSYTRTGRPWTYTVLNTGPPGVGKTKLVKAIAEYTKRTLIILNLQHIESIHMLYAAFHNSVLAGEHIPHHQRLYYIPEVDTQMFEMLKNRDSGSAKQGPQLFKKSGDNAKSDDKNTGGDLVTIIKDKKPTLGEILNVLDGVPERHGHILILDTNHLHMLDPALIRPGRVDRIVYWQKLSSLMTRQYVENYYGKSLPKGIEIPDRTLTAAELQANIYKYPSIEDYVKTLDSRPRVLRSCRNKQV